MNTTTPHWFIGSTERDAYRLLYREFFRLKKRIQAEYDTAYKEVKCENKLIGCVVRGTDYLIKKLAGHPKQASLNKVFKILDKMLSNGYLLFLATDEKRYLDLFTARYGNRVMTTDSIYYDDLYGSDNININEFRTERENDKFLQGYEYFRRVYILSKCDGLVSSMSGATRMALIMKEGEYSPKIIFNEGFY